MKQTHLLSIRRPAATTLLLAALAIGAAPGAALSIPAAGARAGLGLAAYTRPAPAPDAASNRVSITLTDSGFTPASASAAAGLVHLAVENRTDDPALTLLVTRADGEPVRELTAPDGAREWLVELDLGPGGYVIKAAANPSWSFALTVR